MAKRKSTCKRKNNDLQKLHRKLKIEKATFRIFVEQRERNNGQREQRNNEQRERNNGQRERNNEQRERNNEQRTEQ
jgi:hypothetical protein